MKRLIMPYASWYQDRKVAFTFPGEWNVTKARLKDAKPLGEKEIREAFASPIGTKIISELASGKRDAVLMVDDLSRPTPTSKVVSLVLDELERGGINENNVRIVMAVGAHRPQNGFDHEMKLGKDIATKLEVLNHNPYERCEYLGVSSRGTPIRINKYVLEADLKIGIGGIIPHGGAGYGGGGKIILPGVAGVETIIANHSISEGNSYGIVEGNEERMDMEEVAFEVGLDVIVNLVMNSEREIAGVFVGDMVKAHREGVKFAEKVYSTRAPKDMDIALVNAYPLDTELFQAIKAVGAGFESVSENGTIVLLAACPEGRGYHPLYEKGGRLWEPPGESWIGERLEEREIMIVSRNLGPKDINQLFPKDTLLFENWDNALNELRKEYNRNINVAVFPCAPIQIFH